MRVDQPEINQPDHFKPILSDKNHDFLVRYYNFMLRIKDEASDTGNLPNGNSNSTGKGLLFPYLASGYLQVGKLLQSLSDGTITDQEDVFKAHGAMRATLKLLGLLKDVSSGKVAWGEPNWRERKPWIYTQYGSRIAVPREPVFVVQNYRHSEYRQAEVEPSTDRFSVFWFDRQPNDFPGLESLNHHPLSSQIRFLIHRQSSEVTISAEIVVKELRLIHKASGALILSYIPNTYNRIRGFKHAPFILGEGNLSECLEQRRRLLSCLGVGNLNNATSNFLK